MTDPTPNRRFSPTPSWLIFGLLVVEGLLWLSERYRCPTWHKGYAVVIGVASVVVVFAVMLLWFVASQLFRWRFQFSISLLLVLTVAVALPCSWLAVEIQEANREEAAATATEKSGGELLWDVNPSGPAWLRGILGEHFFGHVKAVELRGDPVTGIMTEPLDATLEPLHALNQLQDLRLYGKNITDAHLEHLNGLRNLTTLCLDGTKVSDAGLEKLAALNQLEELGLTGTKVTDAGLKKLVRLNKLRWLRLDVTTVTDASLEILRQMKQLRFVDLANTNVTDAGLERFREAMPHCDFHPYDGKPFRSNDGK